MTGAVVARCLVSFILFFNSLWNLTNVVLMVGPTGLIPLMYILSKVFPREANEELVMKATTLLAQWR